MTSLEIRLRSALHTLYEIQKEHGKKFPVTIGNETQTTSQWVRRLFVAGEQRGIDLRKGKKKK